MKKEKVKEIIITIFGIIASLLAGTIVGYLLSLIC